MTYYCKLTGLGAWVRPDLGLTLSRSNAAALPTYDQAVNLAADYSARCSTPPGITIEEV